MQSQPVAPEPEQTRGARNTGYSALMNDAPKPSAGSRGHTPVLPAEVMRLLAPVSEAGDTVVDCTAGLGGHAAMLAGALGERGTVVLNDLDAGNLARAAERVRAGGCAARIVELRGNFADVPRRMAELGLSADAVLADLGFSSNQVEDPARGLSFMRDGPLDMRLDPGARVSAAQLVNTLPEAELAEVLHEFGEERAARRIAQKLVAARQVSPIQTTGQLASIVRSVVGSHGGIDPATRTFQALRIAVNDELGSLRSLLESIGRAAGRPGGWLKPGARIGIISFHSLEDRLVKNAFGELVDRGLAEALSRRPVEASDAEVVENPRSRSAKFRVVRLASARAV